jgi:DNA-binding transcriptional LysR family regulator
MQLELNSTLIFVKVVEKGSFAAAARALGLPNSTVSRKVRELEAQLGARLLNRTTRKLALTEAGTVYFESCRSIERDLEDARNAVQELEGSPRGWLRVTAPYSLSSTMLAPVLHSFREHYPGVHVDLVLSNDLLDLVEHKIDVALRVRVGELPDSSLIARPLSTWTTHLYAGAGYLERHGVPGTPDELIEHHTLAHSSQRRNQHFAWPLRKDADLHDYTIEPVVVANDADVLLPLMRADHGIILASDVMVGCYQNGDNVRRILPEWQGPDLSLNATFVGGAAISPKTRAFVDFLANEMQREFERLPCPAVAGECRAAALDHAPC